MSITMERSPQRGPVAGRESAAGNGGVNEVQALVEQVNVAFKDFRANHTAQLDEIKNTTRADITELQAAVDDINLKLCAQQMGGGTAPKAVAVAPFDFAGVKALRTAEDFCAHATLIAKQNDDGPRESIGLGALFRGVAGMSTTPGAIRALSRGTDSAGGYAVPAITNAEILSALAPISSLIAAGAGVVPMDVAAKSVTYPAVETLPVAGWRSEGGNVKLSEPTFRAVQAVPQSLAVIIKVTRELLADAPGMDAALRTAIAQAFAAEFDRVGLRGSGDAPEPRGLANLAGVHVIEHGGANGDTLENYAPVLAAYQAIMNANGPTPTGIIAAPRTAITWAGLTDTTGQPLMRPELLAQVPIYSTSQIPVDLTVGTATDCSEIYVGAFGNLFFLQREAVSIQLLREAFAATGELGFLVHARVDVVVPYPQAFVVVKGIRA